MGIAESILSYAEGLHPSYKSQSLPSGIRISDTV